MAIIDVRTPGEYARGHVEGAQLIDVHEPSFLATVGKLPRDKSYLVYCATGGRSAYAVRQMRALGLDARNLVGGIAAWRKEGFPIAVPARRA